MSKIGTVHVEIKPVLNQEALDDLTRQIEVAVNAAQTAATDIYTGKYYESDRARVASDDPELAARGYTGWIADNAETWIIFLGPDGRPALYWPNREESGAVIGEPVELTR